LLINFYYIQSDNLTVGLRVFGVRLTVFARCLDVWTFFSWISFEAYLL